jgi:hypothetical protein
MLCGCVSTASHASSGVVMAGLVVEAAEGGVEIGAGKSSLAGSVHAPRLLSFARPKPSSDVRERRPESEARPPGVRVEEEEGEKEGE